MTTKIPINEYGEGNCCPVCGSTRITIYEQRLLYVNVNLKTGKPFIMRNGKMKQMSNRDKANDFDGASVAGGGCWNYCCRKCGWISGMFVE